MTRRSPRRRPALSGLLGAALAGALLAGALVVGCGAPGVGPGAGAPAAGVPAAVTVPAAACQALAAGVTASPGSAAAAPDGSAVQPRGAGVAPLPDVRLPCLGGVGTVHLRQLRGPVVVNLWASWCRPCRDELPTFQRYAQQAAGRVSVVGVNTADGSAGRDAIVADLGLTFPILVDERAVLRAELGRAALPVTVFVDVDGRMAYVHNDVVPDITALHRLAGQHLGVVTG
ncbi:MAG TPA: TlpA disulfide reductase family protein [Micromonosporaceae bacterium]|nr:TlpA disulfide reductase family protein [Micromonosporaceae bacterium]